MRSLLKGLSLIFFLLNKKTQRKSYAISNIHNYKKPDVKFLNKKNINERPFKRDLIHSTYLEKNYLNYFLGKGNNEALIEKLMQKRKWWKRLETKGNFYISFIQ